MEQLDGCRVLVVEDEFYLAKDIRETLLAAGATILGPHPRNAEARAAVSERPPAVAVLDVNLGGGPDFSLADEMRAMGVPVIFFTGYDREAIPDRFADVPRLEKPVGTTKLVSTVQEACRRDR